MYKPLVRIFLFLAFLLASNASLSQSFGFQYEQFDTDDGLPSSEIYDLYEDPTGNIWLATDRGVVRYNGYDFSTYNIKNGLSNLVNFSFQPVGDGTFWLIGLDGTLSYWNGQGFETFAFNTAVKNLRSNKRSWLEFLGIKDDVLFLQTISRNKKEIVFPIYSVNVCNGKIKKYGITFLDSLNNLKQSDQIIKRRINIVRNKKAIEDTLEKNALITSNTHFQWDNQNNLKGAKFIGTPVNGLYIDKNRGEWVTTNFGVLYFKNGNLSTKPTVFFKGVGITSVSESKDGSLWLTSTDNGLFHIPNINIKKYLPNGWADGETAYKLKKAGNFLLGLSEKSNYFLLEKNQSNSWHNKIKEGVDYNSKDFTKILNSIKQGKNYFGCLSLPNGNFLRHNSSGFDITPNINNPFKPKYKFRTQSTTKDINGNLWIATTEGLYKWKTEYIKTQPKLIAVQGVEEVRINDVKEDKNGIWATTPRFGLVYKSEFQEYLFKHEKLKDKVLHSIFKQNDSTLWVGSNSGLHKIKYRFKNKVPIIDNIELFTITHGLISNYINDITFWNDEIWLATDKGPCHFKPEQLSPISTIPSLQIDFIETNKKKWVKMDQVTLPFDENDISISYTGISHNKPKNGFYRYKINNRPWVKTNERKVSFLDLNHGKYTFLVQCRSDSEVWSKTESLVFTIQPHLLEKIWFRALAAVFLLVIALLIIMRYRKSWKKKLENENRFRKSELTTLRNQMNPHFIFNSLTAIQGLIYKGEKEEANMYIGVFSRLMRKSLEYSKLENISLEEEIQFIKNYLELEKKRFKTLFDYQITIDPKLVKNSLQIPPLLIQPLLENCIKHGFRGTDKNKQIEILIKSHYKSHIFEVLIKDNGIGFDTTKSLKPSKSKGLGIVSDRISLIREKTHLKEVSFQIKSEIRKGTIIILILPITT